ncbi:hypothetical protein BV25DRAFT_1861229 [Artomyces pyxidatus]|uniref:Uncharacterized protein n=1 Tax=Artomyces pyxidatus TaxID=48021 RepID=A0ACB8STF8_9AGAM|nr:hypothetical protein BV25DRAFT_1861229 [Artomyces pyxidatus]
MPPRRVNKTRAVIKLVEAKHKDQDSTLSGSSEIQISNESVSTPRLPSIPLDVLLEIFLYLSPVELLNLIRSSKWLRSVLRSRSNEQIWRNALQNVPEAPNCPADMNELQYASLVFDTFCQSCLADSLCVPIWELRTRLCDACMGNVIVKRPRPAQKGVDRSSIWCSAMEVLAFRIPMNDIESFEPQGQWYWMDCHRMVYSKGDIDLLNERLPGLSSRGKKDLLNRLRRPQLDPTVYEQFVARRFHEAVAEKKREEQNRIVARTAAICARLQNMGYEEEFAVPEILTALKALPSVHTPQELTDDDWKKIRPDLKARMEKWRKAYRRYQRKEVLLSRCSSFRKMLEEMGHNELPGMTQAHYIDILILPEIKAILDSPGDDEICSETLTTMRTLLPGLWTEWLKALSGRLLNDSPALQAIYDAQKTLDHPAIVLACSQCNRRLFYPPVLYHSCNNAAYNPLHSGPATEIREDLYEHAAQEKCLRKPWSTAQLDVLSTIDHIQDIMHVCGVDPHKGNWLEMNALDGSLRVECKRCSTKVKGSVVMSWRSAVQHVMTAHLRGELEWTLAPADDAARAKELEAKVRDHFEEMHRTSSALYVCTHELCARSAETFRWRELREHMLDRHRQSLTGQSDNYAEHPESPP